VKRHLHPAALVGKADNESANLLFAHIFRVAIVEEKDAAFDSSLHGFLRYDRRSPARGCSAMFGVQGFPDLIEELPGFRYSFASQLSSFFRSIGLGIPGTSCVFDILF
jgi:hypothetical protein